MNSKSQLLKKRRNLVAGFIIASGAALIYGCFFQMGCSKPSSSYLRESCEAAVNANPRVEGIKAWLDANKISYRDEKTPPIGNGYQGSLTDEPPLYNLWQLGIRRNDVERSASYISFEEFPVRWGCGACGYFLFSADGTLIDYRLVVINHPL